MNGTISLLANRSKILYGYLPCDFVDLVHERTGIFRANLMVVACINMLTSAPIVVANALVIAAFVRRPALRRQGNKILLSLSIADFFSGLVAQPCLVATLLLVYFRQPADIPCAIVILSSTVGYTLACVSLLTVSFISFERYLAIFYPYLYGRRMTSQALTVSISVLWLVSVSIISFLLFLNFHSAFFWTNAALIAFSYLWNTYVYICITRRVLQIHHEAFKMTKRFKHVEQRQKERGIDTRVTKVAGSIIIALLVCYLPQVVVSLWRAISDANRIVDRYMEYWAIAFGLANAGLNPLFYCYYNSEIRNEVYAIVAMFKRGGKYTPNTVPQISNTVSTDCSE